MPVSRAVQPLWSESSGVLSVDLAGPLFLARITAWDFHFTLILCFKKNSSW